MDFELLQTVSLRSRSFNVLQAPRDLFIRALNNNLNLQRYRVLYVCGNYSGVLSKLDRKFTDLEIRRAFTVFQLMTVLEEARQVGYKAEISTNFTNFPNFVLQILVCKLAPILQN